MASTSIPEVKAALVEALKNSVALNGITITKGKEPTRESEFIWIPKAKAKRSHTLLGGTPPLDEVVTVTVWVVVTKGTTGPEESEERAFEIVEAVETTLRKPVEAAKQELQPPTVEEIDQSPVPLDKKWACHIEMTVTVTARI